MLRADELPRTTRDSTAGLLSFDHGLVVQPRRLRVLWVENKLDCRMWGYYCDIKQAMEKLHEVCTPYGREMCDGTVQQPFVPEVAVIGPRYSINIVSRDDPVGFDRNRFPRLPLLVMQNKMYVPNGWREIVGNVSAKHVWVREAGASAAFTWLTRHQEFTAVSGVPTYWMPFGVELAKFSPRRGSFGKEAQPFDVGFTGASGADKYPLRSKLLSAVQAMNVTGFFGTWQQTALNKKDPRAWKAGDHTEYALQIARARIWLSTTGPSNIVGTRYFEILASGTTLLMCNRPPAGEWVYDGLFEDGVHVVMFDSVDDMRTKVLYYLHNEALRQRIVAAAHALTRTIHTWDSRARFITRVAEVAIRMQASEAAARYRPPPGARAANDSSFRGCFLQRSNTEKGLRAPPRSRNARKLFRYTVASCEEACAKGSSRYAALIGGGFTTGNGHTLAKCFCAEAALTQADGWRRRPDAECDTQCTLHDARPCGGYRSFALFGPRL